VTEIPTVATAHDERTTTIRPISRPRRSSRSSGRAREHGAAGQGLDGHEHAARAGPGADRAGAGAAGGRSRARGRSCRRSGTGTRTERIVDVLSRTLGNEPVGASAFHDNRKVALGVRGGRSVADLGHGASRAATDPDRPRSGLGRDQQDAGPQTRGRDRHRKPRGRCRVAAAGRPELANTVTSPRTSNA
jgi:hypothetical protein